MVLVKRLIHLSGGRRESPTWLRVYPHPTRCSSLIPPGRDPLVGSYQMEKSPAPPPAWEKLGDIARAWKAARHDTRPGRQTGGGARPQLAEGAPDLRTKPGAHSPAGNGVATGAVSRAENGVMKGADSRSANGVVHGADSRAGKGVDSPAGNGVVKVERWSSIGLGGSVGSARRDAREELVARITDNKSRKRVPGAPADAGGCSSGVAPGVSGVRYCAWHSFPIPKDAPPPSGDVEWGRCAPRATVCGCVYVTQRATRGVLAHFGPSFRYLVSRKPPYVPTDCLP